MARVGETLQWTPTSEEAALRSTAEPEARGSLYDTDEYSWLVRQADLLRDGRLEDLDRLNLIEFLSGMAQDHKSTFESAARVLLHHLLKLRTQPERLTRSWALTIAEQQVRAEKVIANNPGMKPLLPKLYRDAYKDAVRLAAAETGVPKHEFPAQNPWTMAEALAFVPPAPKPRGRRSQPDET